MSEDNPPLAKKSNTQATLKSKAEAITLKNKGWTQQRIADHFGVSQAAVSKWLKDKEKIVAAAATNSSAHRIRVSQYEELNNAVVAHIDARVKATDGRPRGLSWAIIQRYARQKATELAEGGATQYEGFGASNS